MLNYFNFEHSARAFGRDVRLVVGTVIKSRLLPGHLTKAKPKTA